MTEQEILDGTKDWDENRIRDLLRLINRRRDKVSRLWDYCFNKVPRLIERDKTTDLLNEFDYKIVFDAFGEAGQQVDQDKFNVKYVKAICEKMKQEIAITKAKQFAETKKNDIKQYENRNKNPDSWEGMFKEILGAKEIS